MYTIQYTEVGDKIVHQKIGNLTFLVKIDLLICPVYKFFSDFFLICEIKKKKTI